MEEIKQLFQSGHTLKEIGARTGLTERQVTHKIYGIMKLKKPICEPSQMNRIIQLRNWGYSATEISEGEGIKYNTVMKVLELNKEKNESTI